MACDSAFNECVIVFDHNQHGTYFTGQTVTGKVILNFPKYRKLKGIKLQICGFANCQWRERHGRIKPQLNSKKRRRRSYYGREDYIASTTYLVGSEESKNFGMDAGTYTYSFVCPIPLNCPSSFEGAYGHVRYLAKVTIMKSGSSNRVFNVGFTVLHLLDLNYESRLLKVPANSEALENFCFFHTKAVHINIDLQQTGFVPGQMILVSVRVRNEANIDCKQVAIYLNLRATYTSDTPYMRTASEKIKLVKKSCGSVPRLCTRDFAETIRVPATPPSSEYLCKVVRVTYEVCVVAVMNHFMRNPKATIPITIGNVPLTFDAPTPTVGYRSTPDDMPTTSTNVAADARQEESDSCSLGDADTEGDDIDESINLPPPTYEQAMFMTCNIAGDEADAVNPTTNFTPRYPVYNVDEIAGTNPNSLSPPPNPPVKRRRRRRKKTAPTVAPNVEKERPPEEPRESTVEI